MEVGKLTIVSEGDQQPTQWMTLVEVIERIQLTEGCSSAQAQVQLKIGISRGVIPAKWADQRNSLDTATDLGYLPRSRLLLCEHGVALDDNRSGRYRPLLVLRAALDTWPRTCNERALPSERAPTLKRDQAQAKAEKERMRWMTLVEGIEHIQVGMSYEWLEALRQLKNEIGDGLVRVRWADQDGQSDRPNPEYLKASQFFPIGFGLAPDNVNETYRTLLVDRSAVRKLWPVSDVARSILREDEIPSGFSALMEKRVTPLATPWPKINDPVSDHQPVVDKAGRPSIRDKVWHTLSQMRSEGESFDRSDKKLAKDVAKRNGKELGDGGWGDRTVMGHISKWRKGHLNSDLC